MRFHFLILFFLFAHLPQAVNGQKSVRILSYNVLKGFQGKPNQQTRFQNWVKKQHVDIAFFQEMNGFDQHSLQEFAATYGHPYSVIAKDYGYPVAITSRFPIQHVERVLDDMWHGYISAEIQGIRVFAVHLSPFLYKKRLEEVEKITAHAAKLGNRAPVIIAGDFNALHQHDSLQYTSEALQQQLEREQSNPNIRNLRDDQFDYSVTTRMEKHGYVDAITEMKPTVFSYSMPSKSHDRPYKQKIRIDYIWLDKSWLGKICSAEVLYDADTDSLSDHYPILLELTR